MSYTTVTAGQSLLDVAVQELGTIAALFDLADAAGLGITDQLVPGQTLPLPDSAAALPDVARYFANRGQRVNTGDVPATAAMASGDYDKNDYESTDYRTA